MGIILAVQDANISNFFAQFLQQANPTGDSVFFGIILVLIFAFLLWGLGISSISAMLIGLVFLGALHLIFGGVFTILFLVSVALVVMLMAATLFVRFARFG